MQRSPELLGVDVRLREAVDVVGIAARERHQLVGEKYGILVEVLAERVGDDGAQLVELRRLLRNSRDLVNSASDGHAEKVEARQEAKSEAARQLSRALKRWAGGRKRRTFNSWQAAVQATGEAEIVRLEQAAAEAKEAEVTAGTAFSAGKEQHIGRGVRFDALKVRAGSYYTTPIWEFRMKCHMCYHPIVIRT